MSMLPYLEPLTPREPGERQIPEPPRRGEPGGMGAGRVCPGVQRVHCSRPECVRAVLV
jgi:hypothetical protein